MSTENVLANVLPAEMTTVTANMEDVYAVSKNADYLPRVEVKGANSEEVKEGKFPMGEIAFVNGKTLESLGKEADLIVVSVRVKALKISDTPLSYYNRNTPAFQAVVANADVKDSGCMFGPEFLVWVPSKNSFATLFCGGKTTRKEGPNILGIMKNGGESCKPAAMTMKVTFIKTAKYSWHSFVGVPCSSPINPLPDPVKTVEELEKFNNPKDSVVEAATPAEQAAQGRAR